MFKSNDQIEFLSILNQLITRTVAILSLANLEKPQLKATLAVIRNK